MLAGITYSWDGVASLAAKLAVEIEKFHGHHGRPIYAYPVPTAGIAAALVLARHCDQLQLVSDPDYAHIYIDDIVDSGNTRARIFRSHGIKPFYALVHKDTAKDGWVQFPWDEANGDSGPEDNVRRLLQYIGESVTRDGLQETPSRVIRSYKELYSGYGKDPASVFKVFEGEKYDEMVVVKDVEFFSMCEHHMLPFFGKAHIAYIPNGKVIGVSKLARLLEVYSRRLQIQERLCEQVTMALDKYLSPLGSACVLEAKHLCMTARGVGKQNSVMVTSSLTGVFKDPSSQSRSEFLSMVR